MTDVMITDGMKQQVITRLATINSAIVILTLLAERIEHWAWRDLLNKNGAPGQRRRRLNQPRRLR